MKKEAKVEFGIEIVKPWSTAMYDHNEALADVVKEKVHALWVAAYDAAEAEFVDEDDLGNEFIEKADKQSKHPNVVALVVKLREVLDEKGDVRIDLDHMCKILGVTIL